MDVQNVHFDWDDLTEYQWSVKRSKGIKLWQVIRLIYLAIWRPIGFFGGLLYVARWIPKVSFWFAFVITVITSIFYLGEFISAIAIIKTIKYYERYAGNYHFAIWSSIGLIFLLLYPDSFIQQGFQPASPDFFQWLLLAFDNFLSVILLDFPEVFEFHLSAIAPLTWVGKMMIILLRLFFALGLFELMVIAFRVIFAKERFVGSVNEFYREYAFLPDSENLEVACIGKVELLSPRPRFSFGQFKHYFNKSYNEYTKLKNYYLVRKSD